MTSDLLLGLMTGVAIGMSLVAIGSGLFALYALAKVIGFENSTHQIEYREPTYDPFKDEDEDAEMGGLFPSYDDNLSQSPGEEWEQGEDEFAKLNPEERFARLEAKKKAQKKKAKEDEFLKSALVGEDHEDAY